MRILVCLLLVLSPTLFAALTSHHGEAAAAPGTCTHQPELKATRQDQKSSPHRSRATSSATPDDRNQTQPAHSTR